MTLATSRLAYADIEPILSRAASTNGLRLSFLTPGQAAYWRQRAHKLRRLLEAEGIATYSSLVLSLSDSTLTIRPREAPIAIESIDDAPILLTLPGLSAPAADPSFLIDGLSAEELAAELRKVFSPEAEDEDAP